jgi:hypothetical protein
MTRKYPDDAVLIGADAFESFGCGDERVNEYGWLFARIGGVHRDCGPVDISNHRAVVRELERLDPEQEHWGILHASHWAVGWYDHVIVDPTWEAGVKELTEMRNALESYPILDEMLWSAVEAEMHDEGSCRDGECSYCDHNREQHRYQKEDRKKCWGHCFDCDEEKRNAEDEEDEDA